MFSTREAWLTEANKHLAALLAEAGMELGKVQVSVGYPVGKRNLNAVIGQCWAGEATEDGTKSIFINPNQSDPVRILDILLHEDIHAGDNCKSGHRGEFARVARAVGLEGKLTATVAGPALKEKLEKIVAELGEYPHAKMVIVNQAKQTTRMLKLVCAHTGYIVRTTDKWLEAYGAPICPCCETVMERG